MIGLCPMTGKTKYHGRGEARQALRRLRSGDRLRIYPCAGCGCWHLTSNTSSRTSVASYIDARARRRRLRRAA